MKPDELNLLLTLYQVELKRKDKTFNQLLQGKQWGHFREVILEMAGRNEINAKRAQFLLLKWCRQGYYEYGVSLDLGRLTPKGMQLAFDLELALATEEIV